MMKIKIYLAALLLLPLFSACSDWFDGALPKDQQLDDQQYATEEGITAVLNGFYQELSGKSLYGSKLSTTDIELMAHYYYTGDNSTDNYNYFNDLAGFGYGTDNNKAAMKSIWDSAYKLIFRINRFIEKVDATAVIGKEKQALYLGEAYGLRAYLQLDLFRLFGDKNDAQLVPYNQSAEVVAHDGIDTKSYETLLMDDLKKAEELLANDPIRTAGKILEIQGNTAIGSVTGNERFYAYSRNCRMNYYALLALKARTQLYFGHAAEAATTAQTVLTEAFGQTAEDGKPFYWVDKTNIGNSALYNYIFYSEVLFGVNNLDMYTNWQSYTGGTMPGTTYAVGMTNLRGNIFRNDFNSGDLSLWEDIRAAQWTPSRVGNGQYVSNKYTEYTRTNAYMPLNNMQPMLRAGELYLIIAENLILTDAQRGVEYLNNFRMHRGSQAGSLPDPSTTTQEQALDILETEYYKEFYGEGQAFFFLKRNERNTIINPTETGMEEMDSKNYIVPIPQAESEH